MAEYTKQITSEMKKIEKQGVELVNDLLLFAKGDDTKGLDFRREYDSWYTVSRRIVKQLVPEREADFIELYKFPGNRKETNYDTYRIFDFLQGTMVRRLGEEVFSSTNRTFSLFQTQVQILQSAIKNSESILMDIRDVLAVDLFDNEMDKAAALHKNKLLREAGVIAGVVIESHLQAVADAHNVKITKKNPGINDLNEPLKNEGVYDLPTFRNIQYLADIRNLCDHKKDKDPTSEQVSELIEGVNKVIKTIF